MRIGFYLYNLDGDFQLALYNSVKAEAMALGIDLVCIQGEMFREFTKPRRYPFVTAAQAGLDGILIFSSLICYRVSEKMEPVFLDLAKHIPLVSIGMRLFDFPSVVFDNRKPLEALMKHLIITHGYRKLFFLGGQRDHPHNNEREMTFLKTIGAMRKRFPDLSGRVFNSSFTGITGASEFRQYVASHLEEPPDCILGGNDLIALNALDFLRDLPDPRWRDCPVTGFDDLLQARFARPPLTTIRQPLDTMGRLAVRTLFKLMSGKAVPRTIRVNPALVIRRSCGCSGEEAGTEPRAGDPFWENPMVSPHYTQPVSTLGNSLVLIQSFPEMAPPLCAFLDILRIKNFYLLLYPRPLSARIGTTGLAVFRRRDYADELCFNHPQTVKIGPFVDDIIRSGETQAWGLYYLQTGSEILGLMVYEAQEQVYPQMNSCAIFIANTVMRLRNMVREKERARRLEAEVGYRTRDLLELNKKLREESKRREAVEAEVLKISELERRRFSLDLHDDICQRLAGISMYCQSRIGGGKNEPFLRELADQIDETLRRTRRYAHDAFPMELDALGLYEALGSLCNAVNRETSCRCAYTWNAGDTAFLSGAQEINICRIVQEALHNVVKHSRADRAAVEVLREAGDLVIRIRDNGVGLNENEAPGHDGTGPRTGLGLRSMEYRAHQAGAEYALKTVPGGGVCVELRLPGGPKPGDTGKQQKE
jgi:signal transduction histidine kinase/DNA-binding LacI/PurR family transcriptional regulator